MNTACKFPFVWIALAAVLAGCAVQHPPAAPAAMPQPVAPAGGRAYDIDSRQSLLTIIVFRGGALASAGHNHVIASHSLTGTISVDSAQPLQTSFEVHLPVEQLTIDEPELREALHRADFPPEVPESARAGTRKNMLGEALLDASHHPEIVLRSAGLQAGSAPNEVLATVLANVRGEEHPIQATVHYELTGDGLRVSGQLPLKQSELGLKPFSALMGALAVQDQMQVSFDLRAHAQNPL